MKYYKVSQNKYNINSGFDKIYTFYKHDEDIDSLIKIIRDDIFRNIPARYDGYKIIVTRKNSKMIEIKNNYLGNTISTDIELYEIDESEYVDAIII